MKKIPVWLYYSLVIFPFFSAVLSIIIDIFKYNPELAMLDQLLYVEISSWLMWLCILVLTVALVNLIGLLLKKEWARKLYILTMIIFPFGYLLDPNPVIYMSQWALVFNDLCYVALGMLFIILLVPNLYEPIFNVKKE